METRMRHGHAGQIRLFGVLALLAGLLIAPMTTFAQATPEPSASGARVFALPGEEVFPEGITHLEGSDVFYVGSTGDGTIFRGDLISGEVDVFSEGGTDGRAVAIGMKVDEAGRLVVAGGPTGTVWEYDTTTGELIGEWSTGVSEDQFLNDVAIAPSGDAFITDSAQPILYRLPGGDEAAAPDGAGELEPFLAFTDTVVQYEPGFNLNGIVVSDNGEYLLVVQANTGGLFRIDVSTKLVEQVDLGGASLDGGDGMVLDGTTLYVVHGGKVSVVAMNGDLLSGSVEGEFTDQTFSSPTTAAKYGSCLLVVNSQFANRGGTPQLPFTVSEVPIPANLLGEMATPTAMGC